MYSFCSCTALAQLASQLAYHKFQYTANPIGEILVLISSEIDGLTPSYCESKRKFNTQMCWVFARCGSKPTHIVLIQRLGYEKICRISPRLP